MADKTSESPRHFQRSTEELIILVEIEATPDDLDRRLASADWLGERSSTRAEFTGI